MSGLSDFRLTDLDEPAPSRPRRGRERWLPEPLRPDLLEEGEVLSFDQTLGKAGWCLLCHDAGRVEVVECGHVLTEGGQKGWTQKLARVEDVSRAFGPLVARYGAGRAIAHEAPAEGGGKFGNSESSGLASAVLRVHAQLQGVPVTMISSQRVKKLVTGNNPSADKAFIRRAVQEMGWIEGLKRVRNADQRDALAVGLAFLHRHREG